MKVLNTITPSSLDLFSQCRQRWYWSNPMGYRPIARQIALDIGNGVHDALGAYYEHGSDPVVYFREWIDKLIYSTEDGEDIGKLASARALGLAMLEGYLEEYADENFETLAVEQTLSRPLPGTEFKIEARVDTIVRLLDDKKNRAFILEHKTFTRFDEDQIYRDHQLVAQTWLAKTAVDIPVVGVIWNGLRKQVPGPRVKNKLFERHTVRVGDAAIKFFIKRAKAHYETLTQDRLAIYPEPSNMKCGWCSFKQPCLEKIRGGDYQFMLDNLFTKRSDKASSDPDTS